MTATTCTLSADLQQATMPTRSTTYDPCPKRYLRREWKKYSPYIPKHCSLPVLRLVPNDRPLFVCEKCSSSNMYLPLCLWCRWTSESAVQSFENDTPRSRTLSAPKFSSDLVDRKRTDKKRRVGVVIGGVKQPRTSIESGNSTEPPITPRTPCTLVGFEGIAGAGPCWDEQIQQSSFDGVNWVSRTVDLNQDNDQPRFTLDHHYLSPLHLSIAAVNQSSAAAAGQTTFDDYNHAETGAQPLISDDDSRPPLRHKRRMSVLIRDSRAKCDRASVLSEPVYSTRPRVSAARHPGHRSMTSSPSPSCRPRRPLYHYIRSNNLPTSRKSPFDCGIVLDTSGDASTVEPVEEYRRPANPSKSQATHDFDFAVPRLIYPTGGFSVSGETEQRMNLARKSDGSGDYKFHEVKGRRRDRISAKIKGVTRSLKDMFKIQ